MSYSSIKNYEGFYEINTEGTVRSLDRKILGKDGITYSKWGRICIPFLHKDVQYFCIALWKNNKGSTQYVHRLVAQTFIKNPDNLPEVNHIDGNRQNNSVGNLEWVSRSGNAQHAVDTGLRVYTNKLTKAEFISCLDSVLEGESYLSLTQRVPYQVPFLSVKLRKLARELNVEHLLDESLYIQRVERARINGTKTKR